MAKQNNYKHIIKREFIKCGQDCDYFLNKYAIIQHPLKGKIKFSLYDFQRTTLTDYIEHRYNIILKSRQLGLSTLTAGYSLWLMLFHSDKLIMCVAKDKDAAKNLITKVEVMYDNLPSWLKVPTSEYNKLSMGLTNGSLIKAVAATPEAGRSDALSLLILDESAFTMYADSIWTAAHQTLATGGDCICLSTPNGVGNWFHKTWQKANSGESQFNPIKLKWTVHPDRDQAWRDQQDLDLGPKMAAQECVWGESVVTVKDNDTGEIKTISLYDLYMELNGG